MTDITFIPTAAGWRYLAVIIDLYSRRIVGWAFADHMRTELVTDAFRQALGSRRVAPGLIFHSDRGSLKNEMLQGGSFASDGDARIEIFDFIESYYNHHRKHSALGYQTPAQFEAKKHPNN